MTLGVERKKRAGLIPCSGCRIRACTENLGTRANPCANEGH